MARHHTVSPTRETSLRIPGRQASFRPVLALVLVATMTLGAVRSSPAITPTFDTPAHLADAGTATPMGGLCWGCGM
jgi:hypothetical protein